MRSSRRVVAALGLAAGIAGLAVPMANAAPTRAPHKALLNPMTTLDAIAVSDIPDGHQSQVPKVSEQMRAEPGQPAGQAAPGHRPQPARDGRAA
ncbi:hypothetical protein ACQ4WX_44430 [Streptomyces lasalocidi]